MAAVSTGTGLSVGDRLRAAREQKKLSIEDVHRVTKIQKSILQAIEQGRVEDLLDPAYVKILVKKYGAFLGMEGNVLAQGYASGSSWAGTAQGPKLAVETEITVYKQKRPALAWAIPALAALLGLVGVGVLGYLVVDLAGNLRQQRNLSAQASSAAGKPAEPELIVPISKPLKLSIQTTADVWLQVKSDGAVIFQNVLPKGSREGWTAQKELELWTGNAGAMKLSLNGTPLEGLGRGVKKGVRVTHRGIEQ